MRGIVLFLAYVASLVIVAAAYGGEPVPAPAPVSDAAAADAAFAAFIKDFRVEALAAGIRPEVYDRATATIARNQRVFDNNTNQPEFARPVWDYIDSAVSPDRIANGRALMAGDAGILQPVEAQYRVPAEIVVSVWGNESDYGRGQGRYNMFEALATLAYDGPRMAYARPQLIAALKMMQRENYDPAAMTSSWAGAFGQTQFVPTTFLAEAVDGDGDGKIDLWLNAADALASTAHVLADAGWMAGKPWGYEVALPLGFAFEEADLDSTHSITHWRRLGIKTMAGTPLPPAAEAASIYLPAGARGPAFLVFPNFKVILKYNNAASYALAVCLLADQIKGAPPVMAGWPRELAPLNRNQRLALQSSLLTLGFDIGKVDGLIGGRTRAAVRAWQKAHGFPADGFATQEILTRLAMDAKAKSDTQSATP